MASLGAPALGGRPVSVGADDLLLSALSSLAAALEEAGVPSMLIGGLAVIAHGVPRQTVDIDAAAWAESLDLEEFVGTLREHGVVGRIPDLLPFARQYQVLLLEHRPSGTPIDLSLAWLPFEREAIARAEPVDFGGVRIPLVRLDDLVVYKAIAWRDRDRGDIERLLRLHGGHLDREAVRATIAEFAEALDEPERLTAFDDLVRGVLGPERR